MSTAQAPTPAILRMLAVIKFGKGLLLAGLALGVFRLINADLSEEARKITFRLRIDPENTYVRWLIERLGQVEPKTLRQWGWISAFFSLDLLVEGVGLWFNQSWALYLVLVATSVFVPYELYLCFKSFSWEHLGFLIFNLAVVGYLGKYVWTLRRTRKSPP